MWLTVIRYALPYVIASAVGFSIAWGLQGLRLDSAKADVAKEAQKLDDYKNHIRALAMQAEEEAEQRRKETANDYAKKLAAINKDHEAYKRCVAAGKCGARVIRMPNLSAGSEGVPPPGRTDGAGANTVPVAGTVAETDEVITDCARTTLQLNQLQIDIEKQVKE
jgi:hypothetical protein